MVRTGNTGFLLAQAATAPTESGGEPKPTDLCAGPALAFTQKSKPHCSVIF